MITFFTLSISEQEIIRKAYDFEVKAIEDGSSEPNPYKDAVKNMGLWEALEEALEEAYN